MASAMGVLRWTPETFWSATMFEYTVALKGYLGAKGVKINQGMTRDELLTLIAEDEKGTKAE